MACHLHQRRVARGTSVRITQPPSLRQGATPWVASAGQSSQRGREHTATIFPRKQCGVRAAKMAQLETVPCWVRAMDDETAYMALLLSNTQSEWHPLEEGFHALRSPSNGSEYARQVGKVQQRIAERLCAARVAETVTGYPASIMASATFGRSVSPDNVLVGISWHCNKQ